jgi:hypothetical protein
MIRAALAAMLLVLPVPVTLAPLSPEKRVQNVRVNGHRYKVQTKGRQAFVTYKATFAVIRPETPSEMRQAALEATGCQIADWVVHGATMAGILDCPAP